MSLKVDKLQNLIDSYHIKNIKLYNMIQEVKEKELFKILIETDADMSVKDENGNTPLHRNKGVNICLIISTKISSFISPHNIIYIIRHITILR